MNEYNKPLPVIDEGNRTYWQGLQEGKVLLQTCNDCGNFRLYAFRKCPNCGSESSHWKTLPGTGEIWSVGIFHHVYFEGFRNEAPYNVVIVQFDKGPRVYSNIVGATTEDIRIGARVKPVFEVVTENVTLLKFSLAPE